MFDDTDLIIIHKGRLHLGIPLDTTTYHNQCIYNKVHEWCGQVGNLALFAKSQPQAAFSAFSHGVMCGWMFFMRMVPLSSNQLKPLEDVIRHQFIPAVSGRHTITEEERDLFSLPIRDGGMGIPIPQQTLLQQ